MDLLAAIGWPVVDRLRLGPVAISPHGLGIAAGYLAGAWWMVREGRKRGVSEDHAGTILLWALVGAIAGARGFYVIGHFSEFESVGEMLAVWRGGISLIGGIVGAMLAAYPFMRKFGYRFLQVMDSAALGLAFGIALGRIGDLVIGDHLGKPTSWALSWVYQGGQLAGYDCAQDLCRTTLANGDLQSIGIGTAQTIGEGGRIVAEGIGVHQTALYDLFIAAGLFLFLFWFNRKPRREGILIMSFAIWYGAGRVITDMLRVDKQFFGLTGSQWTSVAAIVLSIVTLVRYAMRPGPGPAAQPAGVEGVGDEAPTTAFEPPTRPEG